jgi:hypothetical protein
MVEHKQPIPVLGVPIINGVHWLKKLIYSIDYPIDNLVIINNNNTSEFKKEIDKLVEFGNPLVKNIKVSHLPGNIGCAGAWNLIIKSSIMSPYWIIANHDVEFTFGLLEEMNIFAQNPQSKLVLQKDNNQYWTCFLIKDIAIQEYGLFDEIFYPAYGEDIDYQMRFFNNDDESSIFFCTIPIKHGSGFDYKYNGSQTIRDNLFSEFAQRIFNATDLNNVYLNLKWGPESSNHVYNETTFPCPFNDPKYSLNMNSYDLFFLRNKYIGL